MLWIIIAIDSEASGVKGTGLILLLSGESAEGTRRELKVTSDTVS